MSGITIMLVYFNHIFDNIDGHKQEVQLSTKQMSSYLTTAVVMGGAASLKVMEKATRRQAFCGGHLMIGVFLYGAGHFEK